MTVYSFVDESGETRLRGTIDPAPSQSFVRVSLRHSADPANITSNAPVVTPTGSPFVAASVTLPLLGFGNSGQVNVLVSSDIPTDVDVSGALVVVNADGSVWIEQDTAGSQTVAAGTAASIDFSSAGGGAGAGLSWNTTDKQVDIASAGAYAAFVTLIAVPA